MAWSKTLPAKETNTKLEEHLFQYKGVNILSCVYINYVRHKYARYM